MASNSLPVAQDCEGLHDSTGQGYSHIVSIPPGAKVVLISGQYASGATPAVVSPRFEDQIKQAFDNLCTAIRAVGATPQSVARLGVFIVDHSETKLPLLGEQLVHVFGDYRPALTVVPVPKLAMDSILFEVEATVLVP